MVNKNIERITLPYKDIFTTVYLIKTKNGYLLFDTASYDSDVEQILLPWLSKLGVTEQNLKYIFISHHHADHVGGLKKLAEKFQNTVILGGSPKLIDEYGESRVILTKDNDTFLDVLRVVTIPGHTTDSAAIIDTRTKTMVTGDSLQLYGIFGSGAWGSNITLPFEHKKAINKLYALDIEEILTAHDYHPCGCFYKGKEQIKKALDYCIEPLENIAALIIRLPSLDDEQIVAIHQSTANMPTVSPRVAAALREVIKTKGDF